MDQALLEQGGVVVAQDGAVLTVTMNRPEIRNAMRPSTWAAFAAIGASIGEDVRVVVVRGAGESFCAGLDKRVLMGGGIEGEAPVADLFGMAQEDFDQTIATFQEGFLWLRDPRFISIAAVQGYAVGGGFQLALACDLRIATDGAQFSMREPALGIIPDVTGTKHLVECVGYSRALELTASARNVDATEAFAMGLVNRVVPEAGLDAAVAETVTAMTTHPAGAVRGTKRVLLGATERTFDEQRAWERAVQFDRFREIASGN
ncbi:enoyl-CoA hydratase/isomerase family protein [Nocardioides marmorisolisilvae]|uniref:Enoyl-CoA hydratase/isomerase family protein n=1 Tax=Nocardioides marmorisolisilvae TaxID=1542737 RepID=A0A3N0DUV6_9ACTN|nr:enoyl-CoA hydratase/isomerase family protein [Nocardioides marmorisolisilvae]RNL79407.1 enoyl-CoA hydratase/isomerase family protein [Nocardioides marmorisolisilvae]